MQLDVSGIYAFHKACAQAARRGEAPPTFEQVTAAAAALPTPSGQLQSGASTRPATAVDVFAYRAACVAAVRRGQPSPTFEAFAGASRVASLQRPLVSPSSRGGPTLRTTQEIYAFHRQQAAEARAKTGA